MPNACRPGFDAQSCGRPRHPRASSRTAGVVSHAGHRPRERHLGVGHRVPPRHGRRDGWPRGVGQPGRRRPAPCHPGVPTLGAQRDRDIRRCDAFSAPSYRSAGFDDQADAGRRIRARWSAAPGAPLFAQRARGTAPVPRRCQDRAGTDPRLGSCPDSSSPTAPRRSTTS